METSAAFAVEKSPSQQAYRAMLTGGLLAGVLDIVAVCVNSSRSGATPTRVLQAIAGGLLGAAAYKGGVATAWLGLVLHFLIATVATAVFYAASRKLKWMTRWATLSGLAYGAAVYGADAEVVFAGAQGGCNGLDQCNVRLPRSLAGRGDQEVVLTIDGQAANPVRITIR